MPSLAVAHSSNVSLQLPQPVAVIVGGTAGIGAAMAIKFAQYSTDPEVHIVGRNETAAQSVINQLNSANPSGKYHFHKCDLTLLAQTRELITTLRSSIPKISHLVLSQGILTMNGRTETVEGNDVKMMLLYYSRFLIIRDLLSNLTETARVLSIQGNLRGDPNKILWDDLDLRLEKNYSWLGATSQAGVLNDLMMDRLAKYNPSRRFIHAFPSAVSTDISNGLPWYMRPIMTLLKIFFFIKPNDSAELLFYSLNASTESNVRFTDGQAEDISGKPRGTEDQLEQAWKHSEELVDKI